MPRTENGTGFQKTDTSYAAGQNIAPKAKTLRTQVLEYLRDQRRPISTADVADGLGRPYGSIQPRLSELRDRGLIVDSGERGTTKYGSSCILWKIADKDKSQ